MSRAGDEFGGPAKKRSGWIIPIAVFLVTAALSAVVLALYIAPTPPELINEQPAPTDSTSLVIVRVGHARFHIPANYILFGSARRSETPLKQLAMVALLPDLAGYSLPTAQDFADTSAESRVVSLTIRDETLPVTGRERLERVFLPQVQNPQGTPVDNSLMLYTFKPESGYRSEELYVGEGDGGAVLLRCTKPSAEVPAPNCRTDMTLANGLALTYHFKRTQLPRWREIDAGIRALMGAFMDKA